MVPLAELPYYAVIFISHLKPELPGYKETLERLETLADDEPGYLGMDSVRNGLGISISYWKTEEDIRRWRAKADHMGAQKMGREVWYQAYSVRICKVERQYEMPLTHSS